MSYNSSLPILILINIVHVKKTQRLTPHQNIIISYDIITSYLTDSTASPVRQ